ncbi:MAG: hypothetical protein ACI3ZQ_03800 [Candidatus Cryptobacteroides sp.]
MDPRLLILVEEDFLMPAAFDAEGRFHKYTKDDESRLWLYFNSSDTAVDNSLKYKQKYISGTARYYGDFFNRVQDGSKAEINGQDLPYFALLSQSGIIGELRDFYRDETGDRGSNIPVSYVFAESISYAARRSFIKEMEGKGFSTMSYSVSPASLMVKYALKTSGEEFGFGDYILVLSSAGDTLRTSISVFDGNSWLTDSSNQDKRGIGAKPLQTALVKHVVDSVDRNKGYLTREDLRQKEYNFQMANAGKWMDIRRVSGGDFDIDDFVYSHDASQRFSCHISGRFLDDVYESIVRETIGGISKYCKETMGNALRLVVMTGMAFEDEEFIIRTRSELGNPVCCYLPTYKVQDALKGFFPEDYELKEELKNFDTIAKRVAGKAKSVNAWIASARQIKELKQRFDAILPDFKDRIGQDSRKLDEMLGLCNDHLKHSRFDDAKEALRLYPIPGTDTGEVRVSVNALLNKAADMQPTFDAVKHVDGARMEVAKINDCSEETAKCFSVLRDMVKSLEEANEAIRFFEAHYDEYLSLKKAFNRADSMQEKRNLVEKMSSLTMEELPALRLNPVKASLYAEIRVTKSGFLGMKKKKELVYRMTVDRNEVLPCDAVINISTEAQICANPGDRFCISIPVEKGTSSYEGELLLPDSRFDARKTILVYLFTAPDVLDIKAIDASYATVKQQ